ncbi:MAG: NAD(P)-dependent oxidoreductase [Elusimicrobia bacterium]|nr:NAD(P)-dependent oxidoreductase [Elusimicrobiota bacterium]
MRIFITGAAGFIGRHLLKRLGSSRHELLLLAQDRREAEKLKPLGRRVLAGDLSRLEVLKRGIRDFDPQACVHLAWGSIPDYSYKASKANLAASLRLFDFLSSETGCRRFVVAGTCAEYGKTRGVCRESDPAAPRSFLGWAKRSLFCCLDYPCAQAGIRLIWFRLFYVYGPGQRSGSLIPGALRALSKGAIPDIRTPMSANDYIYVGDVADALCRALRRNIPSGVYNLGSGKPTRAIDVCRRVEKALTGQSRLSERLARRSAGGAVRFWAGMEKTRRLLRWEPRVALEQGIQLCLESQRGLRPQPKRAMSHEP